MGANFISRHDGGMRELAAELVGEGAGWRALMGELAIPMTTAKNWAESCRAVGPGVFLDMGGSHRGHDYETEPSAARDHVEGGMPKPGVMKEYGIAGPSPPNPWVRKCREGGPEAPRPEPKGRPPGSSPSARPKTREQGLDEENRRPKAGVACLKNEGPGSGRAGTWEKCQAIRGLSGEGRRPAGLLAASGMPASACHYDEAKGPKPPTRPELREGAAEMFSRTPNGCGHGQVAMRPRAEKGPPRRARRR